MSPVLALITLSILSVPERERDGRPHIRSESMIVRWADTGEIILSKDPDRVRPIASITKLLSALILAKDGLPPDEWITLEEQDKDRLKWSKSKLRIAHAYRPLDLFAAALVISENRAVYALIKTPDNNLFRVRKGNYLGQNFGVITQIDEGSVKLREIVQDGAGDWTERASTLQLQEEQEVAKK